jgi:hypothetical protein
MTSALLVARRKAEGSRPKSGQNPIKIRPKSGQNPAGQKTAEKYLRFSDVILLIV